MKVIVLGAGITGVTTAWFLRKAGHEVTVIDRQPSAALETSFANGGQISVSHAEPWATFYNLYKSIRDLGREDAPLLYRFRADWLQWRWGIQFIRECMPRRVDWNIRQIVALAEYSRQTLRKLRTELGLEYDCLTRGILHFYMDQEEFKRSLAAARLMRDLGCPRQSIDVDELVRIEPALAPIREKIVGADFTQTDESGDVYKFTTALAKAAAAAGVQFCYNMTLTRLIKDQANHQTPGQIKAIEVIDEAGWHRTLSADTYVVALGSFSTSLLKPLGINLMIYPGKGYSATYDIIKPEAAPMVSLTDDSHKLVLSRLGNRLRVAGTCEFNGYNRDLNPARCSAITSRVRSLFPEACDYDNPTYWTGLRPLTPSNVPYVGRTKLSNLFLNTGHGTLGWTMGCGSGQAIADIISGQPPQVDFAFTNMGRNRRV